MGMGVSVGVESDDGLRQRAARARLGDPRRTQSTFRSIWRQEKTVGAMLASIVGGSRQTRLLTPWRHGDSGSARMNGIAARPSSGSDRSINERYFLVRRKIALAMHNDIMHTAWVRQILIIFY
jgi:hypothetical protein